MDWISWAGYDLDVLDVEDCFVRGHDYLGGHYNNKCFWWITFSQESFNSIHIRQQLMLLWRSYEWQELSAKSPFIFYICPLLFTWEWIKQLQKASDLLVEIPVSSDCCPFAMHEALKLTFCFPYIDSKPWKLWSTQKMCFVERSLQELFKTSWIHSGDFLCKLFLVLKWLHTIPESPD